MEQGYEWAKTMNCAVTVCNAEGIILFMNEKAQKTFEKYGSLIGQNLFNCHAPSSQEKIKELLASGGSNAYTIEKGSIKKMIYQTAWFSNEKVAGLVELSMEIPQEMPHFIRS